MCVCVCVCVIFILNSFTLFFVFPQPSRGNNNSSDGTVGTSVTHQHVLQLAEIVHHPRALTYFAAFVARDGAQPLLTLWRACDAVRRVSADATVAMIRAVCDFVFVLRSLLFVLVGVRVCVCVC